MPPQQVPTQTLRERQYVTVSSAMVVTATVDPNASYLPVDGDANASATSSVNYGTVTFEGVGGTLTVDGLTTTSTSTDAESPTDSVAASSTSSTKSSSISLGAVIAVAVAVGVLCLLLAFFFWWRRRKARAEKSHARDQRAMHEMNKTYVGGHGYGKETPEGTWEKFNHPPQASRKSLRHSAFGCHVAYRPPYSPYPRQPSFSDLQQALRNRTRRLTAPPAYQTLSNHILSVPLYSQLVSAATSLSPSILRQVNRYRQGQSQQQLRQ